MDNTLLEQLVDSANEVYPDNKILAQLAVTQAILESGFQNGPGSVLAREDHNLFGIKGEGIQGSAPHKTHEYIDGKWIVVTAKFAKNASWADSFAQHRKLLSHSRYHKVWESKSCPEAFQEVHQAGYATDPEYTNQLTSLWKRYVRDKF